LHYSKTKALLQTVITLLDPANAQYFPIKHQRILICTPSHTAANVITQRLGEHFDTTKLLRLVGQERPIATMPRDILAYCRRDESTGSFTLPADILTYSIIVCTCVDAHLLYKVGLTNAQLRNRRQCFQQSLDNVCVGKNIGSAKLTGINEPHFR
jgi:ERCC4-related helicase